jgi:hypothetical protein
VVTKIKDCFQSGGWKTASLLGYLYRWFFHNKTLFAMNGAVIQLVYQTHTQPNLKEQEYYRATGAASRRTYRLTIRRNKVSKHKIRNSTKPILSWPFLFTAPARLSPAKINARVW